MHTQHHKNKQVGLHQIKKHLHSKRNNQHVKIQLVKKIANRVFDVLRHKIYKGLI